MSAHRRHKLKLLIAALCAAALVAGCGGDSYRDDVKAASEEFEKSTKAAFSKYRSAKSKKDFSAGVDQFQAAIRKFNAKLKDLEPPDGAKDEQARLIKVLNQFSADMGATRDALNKGDVAKVQSLQEKVVTDVGAVRSAEQALDKATD